MSEVGAVGSEPQTPAGDGGLLFRGRDVEELSDLIRVRFAPHRLSVLADLPLDGRFRCLREGTVALYELGYGSEVDVTPEAPLDFYNIHVPLAGDGAVTLNGKLLSSPLSVAGPDQKLGMRWSHDSVNRVLIIPRRSIDQAVAVRLGDLPQRPVDFVPVLDDRAEPVTAWLTAVAHFAEFAGSALAARSPLAVQHFEQLLVNGLLDAQPHVLSEAVAGRGCAALPSAVRRATAFCAEHAAEPISVADMAQAARVGVRSLREGFRMHLDTTPLAYLRGVRLDLARRDLLAAADGDAPRTVTDVALRWGFTHLGRFTGHYRKAYGETPSQTLRSSFGFG
ncbi:AraC family transcriptional regulator [Streptomyces sp. NBC_01232]|uniref:AraC family transcriptional regulator n=1 Tax=Streptomyces sp. NBC_01232 TaxID=2903786 RepID=UPI002E147138|nr:AraC family transcriptional regulator [Streptomyces sp. NBC_01232]